MLTRKQLHRLDAGRNTHYYTDQQDDYYNKDATDGTHELNDTASQWQGKGVDILGLSGKVDPARFASMLRGEISPGLHTNRTVRSDADKRTALDLTFSAPKSVTIQGLVGKDSGVVRAHDVAVSLTLDYIERELTRARRSVNGKTQLEQTDNLVIAKFRHETARPTADAPPDPQLHTHAILMNFTQRADGSWAALSNNEIIQRLKLLDSVYQSELAHQLEKQGYVLRHEGGHFELAHISREQIEAFSKRGKQVSDELVKRNLTRLTASHALKQSIVLSKRLQKMASALSRSELQRAWESQARELGLNFGVPVAAVEKHELASPADKHAPLNKESDEVPSTGLEEQSAIIPTSTTHKVLNELEPPQTDTDYESPPDLDSLQTPGQAESLPLDAGFDPPSDFDTHQSQDLDGALQSNPDDRQPPGEAIFQHTSPGHRQSATATPSASPATQHELSSKAHASEATKSLIASAAVVWGIKHLTERESVMARSTLLEAALRHAGTATTITEIESAIANRIESGHLIEGAPQFRPAGVEDGPALTVQQWTAVLVDRGMPLKKAKKTVRNGIASGRLCKAEPSYTTQGALEREKRILQIERDGRDQLAPILSLEVAKSTLSTMKLRPGQQAAAEAILTTTNRVIGVQGLAGTGKSHMQNKVKEIAEANGFKMVALASYGPQVDALHELGIEARTVASFIHAQKPEKFALDEKTILLVDEAGVLATKNLEIVLQRAEQFGCRVVLVGDTEQTKAIEAGRPFSQLQAAGMQTARMGDIIRQKDPTLKRAVELAADTLAAQAVEVLKSSVHSINLNASRYIQIAEDYAALTEAERKETLIVTGTNASRRSINEFVHEELGLKNKGEICNTLYRQDSTQAQRRHARYYKTGSYIQPERTYANGLQADQLYKITDIIGHQITVVNVGDIAAPAITFNPAQATKLSVYQPTHREISPGESIRITRHNAALDIANGEEFTVSAVTKDFIEIQNSKHTLKLPTNAPLHLDYAYALTVHSAQGQTKDRILMNVETFSRTTKTDVFYVGISRPKLEAKIYTDDAKKLPAAVNRWETKTAALDIARSHNRRAAPSHGREAGHARFAR